MKYLVEHHAYAPELNKLFRLVGDNAVLIARAGSSVGVQAFSSLKEFREKNRRSVPYVRATVSTHYTNPEYKSLERTYSGRVDKRADALTFARRVKQGLCTGGTVSVRTRLVY